MAFGRTLTDSFTQVLWVLIENQTHDLGGESRLLWWSRPPKPLWYRIVSINPKTNWRNHCAFDEAPWWFNIKTHQREFRCFVFHCTKICSYVSWYSRDFIPMKLLDSKWLITMSLNEFILKHASISKSLDKWPAFVVSWSTRFAFQAGRSGFNPWFDL
jgi:hypothetical protein